MCYSLSTQTPRKRLFTNLWCTIMIHPTCDGLCQSDSYAVSLRLNHLLALLIILTACLQAEMIRIQVLFESDS